MPWSVTLILSHVFLAGKFCFQKMAVPRSWNGVSGLIDDVHSSLEGKLMGSQT